MAKMPKHNMPAPDQAQDALRPTPPRRRFRWSLVLVPIICILAAWILNHVQPALTWQEILDRVHIQGQERVRMSRLVALGLICVGAVMIKRIWVSD